MKWLRLTLFCIATIQLTGCANWIFRIDVPQGNFVDQDDVEKLRIGMSKEQVLFVLGKPVVKDSFDKDVFYYIYTMKRGMSDRGDDVYKEFYVHFEDDKVTRVSGDYTPSEDFNTPLDQ